MSGLILPRRLEPGSRLWLTSPASSLSRPESLEDMEAHLRSLGFEVETAPAAGNKWRFFAGTDAERARDINQAFARPEIDAVICTRGGYGSMRLLEAIDWDLVRRNPKIVMGYSDITALLNAVRQRAGVAAFHAPTPVRPQSEFTRPWLMRAVTQAEPLGVMPTPETDNPDFTVKALRPGKAQGPLAGGNLTLISTLMGTPWQIGRPGDILFFEDVNESPYRVDRMLTQLLLAGVLQQSAGLAFGQFTGGSEEGEEDSGPTVHDVIAERTATLGIPVLMGLPFGHVRDNALLPIGCQAEIDADAGALRVIEPAVR